MYTAISQTRNINIEASLLLLETTSVEKRSYEYNKFLLFIVTNTLTIYIEVQPLYLAYITHVFLTSSPIE